MPNNVLFVKKKKMHMHRIWAKRHFGPTSFSYTGVFTCVKWLSDGSFL